MLREKSPGMKILWLWTFGTAAVLVTSVVRTRIRDMEKIMNNQDEEQPIGTESTLINLPSESDRVIREDDR